jgi:RNA-directed DNA polymerase
MLNSKIFHNGNVYDSEMGTPQGGVISPMLSNVALTTLDNYISDKYGYKHSAGYASPLIRYADDFIIICKSKLIAKEIKKEISEHLKNEIGLTLSEEKTKITHITDGFNFLGFNIKKHKKRIHHKKSIDMSDYVLLITPQKDKINNILRECADTLSQCITAPQEAVIYLLNPQIIGWANYYKYVVSSQIFCKIDSILWKKLLKWGTRRHVNKGKRWVIKKYFCGKNTSFATKEGTTLRNMYSIFSDKRFVKVKQGHRVYCSDNKDYWEKREYLRAYDRLFSHNARRLFDYQKGKCPFCKSQIRETDIIQSETHIHHMLPHTFGGSDRYSNLRLLHSQCHTELHSAFSTNQMNALVNKKLDYVNTFKDIIDNNYHENVVI